MRAIKRIALAHVLAMLLVACGSDSGIQTTLSDNARLSDLSISAGTFDQIFQSNQPNYTAAVSLLGSTTTVTATAAHTNATVAVDGVAVTSSSPSSKLTLNQGSNVITALVTAEDRTTTNTYAIEVTRQTVASFAQQAYIKASNTDGAVCPGCDDRGDQFGTAIALDGRTLAVGAIGEGSAAAGINGDQSDNSALGSGAVYVFVRDDSGMWRQQAYIKASNPDGNNIPGLTESRLGDNFGASIVLYGDTLAVGAPGEDGGVGGIGGDESDNSALDSGAVYVFARNDGDWNQQAYIKSPNPIGGQLYEDDAPFISGGEEFGTSVALQEDTLVVTSPFWGPRTFIYERDEGNQWTFATQLDGARISLDDNTLVLKKPSEAAVYVYDRQSNGEWQQQARLESPSPYGDGFGTASSLSGGSLAVAAPADASSAMGVNGDNSDNSLPGSGAVYVFVKGDNNNWTSQAYIKASNPVEIARFGHTVALDGDVLAVGVPREDGGGSGINGDQTEGPSSTGATYLFTRDSDGLWSQQAYIKASNPNWRDFFGQSVALDGGTLVISASHEDSSAIGIDGGQSDNSAEDSGAAYVFY